MRFVVDTNLPPVVAELLRSLGHDAEHTSEVGLAKATDRAIWTFAGDNGAAIVSKDEDFVLLKAAEPNGPAIIWVRTGNAVRRVILQRLNAVWPQVVAQLASGEAVVEIR